MKIFITGVTASGKTYLAKKISEKINIEYYDFDIHWFENPITPLVNKKDFLYNLPDSFVIDAIPDINRYDSFQEYRNNKNVLVIGVFQSDITQWIKNVINKPFFTVLNYSNLDNIIPNVYFHTNFYDAWMYFYTIETELIKPTFFYDNSLSKIMTTEEFRKVREGIIEQLLILKAKNQHLFKDYLDTFDAKIYDKFYQDIECIDFIGYSKSYKTWEHIKDLVDWENKTVIDLGCYHGYFSFKAEQMGAFKIIGLEKWNSVLEITEMIKHMLQSKVEFKIWDAGQKTPQADIALILNILHHTMDIDKTLQNINAKTAIFEIEKNQIELVKKYFTIIKEVESHRADATQDRIILLGEKKC